MSANHSNAARWGTRCADYLDEMRVALRLGRESDTIVWAARAYWAAVYAATCARLDGGQS